MLDKSVVSRKKYFQSLEVLGLDITYFDIPKAFSIKTLIQYDNNWE